MNHNNTTTIEPPSLTDRDIEKLYRLAAKAGQAILEVYLDESQWHQRNKSDHTPVTSADLRSSELIVDGLPAILNCPVISEESLPSYQERRDWVTYWLVDPLDGTREFLHRTDEFVINIALMHHQQPIFGLLYQPTTKLSWWGGKGYGAFVGVPSDFQPIEPGVMSRSVIALGSRRSRWTGEWKSKLAAQGYSVETQSVGSALKFAYLAQGRADLYPRLGPTSEWDTAAPQAILDVTGGAIRQWNGQPLQYGKKNFLNPHFVAVRDTALLDVLI